VKGVSWLGLGCFIRGAMVLKRSDTGFCCREYADYLTHDKCEVSYLLNRDEEYRKWLKVGTFVQKFDIHHIYGRPLPVERNYWCNLIRISKAAHMFGHDRSPRALEICCWLAKAEKHKHVLEWLEMLGKPLPSVENYDFHEETLNRVVVPFSTFYGRVEYLTAECRGTPFESCGRQLLTLIEEFRAKV
jgi:hypothetical protein